MIEIALDTETTGFDALSGDKIVEIGCVKLKNHIPSDETFHVYINPERIVPEDSIRVHGLTNEFLDDKPIFSEVASDFLEFISDYPLVIHNAEFDMGFLNAELQNIGLPKIANKIVDTLLIARQRYPGSPANLDHLCKKFSIDNSNRTLHGALLDAELLSEVYLEFNGGREPELLKESQNLKTDSMQSNFIQEKIDIKQRVFDVSQEELDAYNEMMKKIKKEN